jgi:DEAD/DEAH box helicase domain-containing protein
MAFDLGEESMVGAHADIKAGMPGGAALARDDVPGNHMLAAIDLDAKALALELGRFERIVSFNGDRFDFEVLRGYHPVDSLYKKSFDLLVDIRRKLGFRVKLDDLAADTLGLRNTGNGLEIVQWWRDGRREEVCKYCENDVKLLVDLVEFARKKKYVIVNSKQVAVDWF